MVQVFTLLLVLLPYVSPVVRFPADVQPWAALFAWMLLAVHIATKGWRISRIDGILIVLSIILGFYVFPDNLGLVSQYLRKSLAFVFSLSIFFLARTLSVKHATRAAIIAVSLYLAFAILQYLANPLYAHLVGSIVPLGIQFGGGRGASSLSREATDFGFTAAYLMMLLILVGNLGSRTTGTRLAMLGAVLCVLLSKSGSGIITLAVIMGLVFARKIRKSNIMGRSWFALVIIIAIFAAYQMGRALIDIRGVQLLVLMVASPAELLDTSFAYRFIHNWVGAIGFFESYGIGFGAGSFTKVAPELYMRHGLATTFGLSGYYSTAVYETLARNPLGMLPMLLLEYGMVGVMYIGTIAFVLVRSKIPHKLPVGLLLLFTWLQSFPVAYPPFWLILGLCRNPQFAKKDHVLTSGDGEVTAYSGRIRPLIPIEGVHRVRPKPSTDSGAFCPPIPVIASGHSGRCRPGPGAAPRA